MDYLKEFYKLTGFDKRIIKYALNHLKLNDRAHEEKHIKDVLESMNTIFKYFDLSYKDKVTCLLAGLMHDIGCHVDRKTHHEVSAKLFKNKFSNSEVIFSDENENVSLSSIVDEVCVLILEHRSSYKGKRSNLLSEIMTLADKGSIDIEIFIIRAFNYRDGMDLTLEEKIHEITLHMMDKFGSHGYGWDTLPALGFEIYKDNIEEIKYYFSDYDRGFDKTLEVLSKRVNKVYHEIQDIEYKNK